MHSKKKDTLKSNEEPKQKNLIKRILLTAAMLTTFVYVINKDKRLLVLLLLIGQALIFKEIIFVAMTRRKMNFISKYLIFHFFVSINIFLLHKSLLPLIGIVIPQKYANLNNFLAFSFYISGFCLFTLNLKRKNLKNQFLTFAVVHCSLFYLCFSVMVAIKNLIRSRFWFAFPALLVITNDIFAYIVGKVIGKRPLLEISPKKTQEGFIGGLFATVIAGLIISYFTMKFHLIKPSYYKLVEEELPVEIFMFKFKIAKIYLHSLFFALFASLVAPFGGFFASGYKRTFKAKDFGTSIPGHGGLADRFDCQMIMAIFTHVYVSTFINPNIVTSSTVFAYITRHLDNNQKKELVNMLTSN